MDSRKSEQIENLWRGYLTTGGFPKERRQQMFFRLLPGTPRCKNCYAPFRGSGSLVVKLMYGKRPSNLNPQLCNICENFAREYQGGAEIELSLLFADVRDSTALAERMTPTEFSKLINRFYTAATRVMVQSDALIDKIIGDQAAGMYVPGFAGSEHASRAVSAAQEILHATGHSDATGPWISLGVGVHTGTAFVGAVGAKDGTTDITVLGDVANTTARLSSKAQAGEILISEPALEAAKMSANGLVQRSLDLKGKSDLMSVFVL